jgi:pimeloyl-ACP methyl ester carboxylesterase
MQSAGEKYIAVKGINIRYVVKGAGSPLLLIHGFGEFLEVWWYNIDSLSKHYLVYAMDLPGHGLSDKPPIDYKLFFIAEFVADFMRTLRIERASLVGHSMGGLLGLSVAINFPEKVDKLHMVKSPTLLIHGAQDEVVPVKYARNACNLIPDARLQVIGECGHCPQIEKAPEFNEILMQFLESATSTYSQGSTM